MKAPARPARLVGQALVWAALVAAAGLFSQWPLFSPLPPGHGELKVSLAHLTQRLEPCRVLDAAERDRLPPNMRALEQCARGRAPAVIELSAGEQMLLQQVLEPVGLHSDGRVYLHRSWALPAGDYRVALRLRDSPRTDGFDQEQEFSLRLTSGMSALLRVGDGEAVMVAGELLEEE